MKIVDKEILLKIVLLQLLAWMELSAVGKPLPGCSQTSEIELYDPTDTGAETMCITCPECPEGQGLSIQCGSRVPKDTKIECILCQVNVSYSDKHGIESCKACQDCGVMDVIEHCTTDKNRICGTKCPQGHFLDHNHICQECYFCCGSVSEAKRRQGCKDIGMSRHWQCEKTEQNQRCKDLEKVTTLPTHTKPHGAVSLGLVMVGVVSIIIVIISVFVLIASRTGIRVEYFGSSRTNNSKTAGWTGETGQDQGTSGTEFHLPPATKTLQNSGIPQIDLNALLNEPVHSISLEYCERICLKLDIRNAMSVYNFRLLAEKVGLDKDEICLLEERENPTERILQKFDTQEDCSIKRFMGILEEMGRHDVIKVIADWVLVQWKKRSNSYYAKGPNYKLDSLV